MHKWHRMGLFLVLAGSVILAVIGAVNFGPAWAAHLGHGTPGTWTATAELCSRKSCSLEGSFIPAGRTVPSVLDAFIGHGSRSSAIGDSEPAIEVSGHIYPAGGGYDWLVWTGSMLVGAAGVVLCTWFMVHRPRRQLAA